MQSDGARACRERPAHSGDWAARRWNMRAWSAALVFLLLVVTVWRAWVVVHVQAGLHVDEAQYWVWSQSLDWGYYSKPPVIAALIALSTSLLGDGLLGVKAFAMLCYPLTAWVLYRWVSEVVADVSPGAGRVPERAGLVAALLFIASPVAGLLGLAATTDAPLLLAWSLASRSLWRAWRDGLPRDWLWLGVWVGLGLMSKYTMAAFAVSALGLLVTVPRERPPGGWPVVKGLGLAVLVALACIAPNLEWNAEHGWPTLRHTAEITIGVESVSRSAALAEYVVGLLLLLGPVVGPVVLASRWTKTSVALRSMRSGTIGTRLQRRDAWFAAAWLGLPLALVGGVQAWHGRAQVNWAAPVLIGATLAVALALRAEWPGRRLRGWYVALALQTVLLAGVTLATDVAHFAHRPLPRKLDVWARMRGWDQAFAQLQPAAEAFWQKQAAIDPKQPRQVLATDRSVLANGAYAWRKLSPHWVAWRAQGELPHDHFQLTSALQPGDQPMPLLLVTDGPPEGAVLAAFEAPPTRIAVADVQQTPGRVLHLELWQAEVAPAPPATQGSPLVAQAKPQVDKRSAKTRRAQVPAAAEKPGQKG